MKRCERRDTGCPSELVLVSQADWYKYGFILSFVYLGVWLGIGSVWWKVLGLW